MDVTEALRAGVSAFCTDFDDSIIEYLASVCEDFVEEENFNPEDWMENLSPILEGFVAEEEDIPKIVDAVIAKVQPKSVESKSLTVEEEPGPISSGPLIDIKPLTLGYFANILLHQTALRLDRGHRYGLIGMNGVGKTTLMNKVADKAIAGFPQDIFTVYVQHEIYSSGKVKVVPFMEKAEKEEKIRRAATKKVLRRTLPTVEEALESVGFTDQHLKCTINELSGGWKMRLALARSMILDADLLLLDEPTNHLDVNAVSWLAKYLRSLEGVTVLMVSHEPEFLDGVVTDIIHIDEKKLNCYPGTFTEFTTQNTSFGVQDLKLSAAPTSKGKDGKSKPFIFNFPNPGRLPGIDSRTQTVLKLTGVDFKYPGTRKETLKNVKTNICLSSRIAIVGPNGAGKSTLVKLLVGEQEPSNPGVGLMWRHYNLRISYVSQHSLFHLSEHLELSPVEYIQLRYKRGTDKESSVMKNKPTEIVQDANNGREIEAILGRRQDRKNIYYEVKYVGLTHHKNRWVKMEELVTAGAGRLIQQCDEKIRARKGGIDQRPLTNAEVLKHLKDFGLVDQYALGRSEQLSGGQRSRLVLAAAMWNKPHILILDEPTNYLDLSALASLGGAIRKFRGGVLMVSHHEDFVSSLCDQLWTMNKGVIKKLKTKTKEEVVELDEEDNRL